MSVSKRVFTFDRIRLSPGPGDYNYNLNKVAGRKNSDKTLTFFNHRLARDNSQESIKSALSNTVSIGNFKFMEP